MDTFACNRNMKTTADEVKAAKWNWHVMKTVCGVDVQL